MDKTTAEIIKEAKGQIKEYEREIHAKYASGPSPELPPVENYNTVFDWFQAVEEIRNHQNPNRCKFAVVYGLVDTYYDQAELIRLCKWYLCEYFPPFAWMEDRLYVDTNVKGNEHPPAWTQLLKDIEQGTEESGGLYKIEVVCMFQHSPAMADFCRQHGVQLVMRQGKGRRS